MAKIDRRQRAEQLLSTDRPFWEQGMVVAGMDEVGRGPLAGNVVVACVVMPPEPVLEWVDDSKKLSESRGDESGIARHGNPHYQGGCNLLCHCGGQHCCKGYQRPADD